MKYLPLFYIIILFFSISCTKEDSPITPPPSTPADVLMPLHVGNSWTYFVKQVNRNGVVLDSGTAIMTITDDSLIGNVTWFSLGTGSLITNKSDGYWIKDSHGSEFLFYRFPGTVGTLYKTADNLNGMLESTHDTLTVPHGNHICYSYQVTQRPPYGNLDVANLYFQPNIGIIRQEVCDNAGFVEYIYLLTGYTLLE